MKLGLLNMDKNQSLSYPHSFSPLPICWLHVLSLHSTFPKKMRTYMTETRLIPSPSCGFRKCQEAFFLRDEQYLKPGYTSFVQRNRVLETNMALRPALHVRGVVVSQKMSLWVPTTQFIIFPLILALKLC